MDIDNIIWFLIVLDEYIFGFAIVFGACLTYDKIFRYKPKKYLLFSFLAAWILPIWLGLSVYMVSWPIAGPSTETLILLETLLFWLFRTDRKPRQLAVSFAAMVFAGFIAAGTSVQFIGLGEILFDSSTVIYPLLCRMFGNILCLEFIVLISLLGNSKLDEPLSLLSIFMLALVAFVSVINMYMEDVSFMNADVFGDKPLLGLVSIIVSVIFFVRDSESKYYSRLNKINEDYLKTQENYYRSEQNAEDEIRRLKHDMKNHLICINELCRKERYEELSEYINDLSDIFNENDSLIFNTGNNIANAIISDKMLRSRENRIRFHVRGSLENAGIAPVDMCAMLANLLDNAIEAASRMPEEQRTIELEFRQNVYFLLITVSNATDMPVDTEKTTKTDKLNHGFGIYNIRHAANKYNGEVNFSCQKEEKAYRFIAEIMLPKSV